MSGAEVLNAARLALHHGFSVIPAAVDGTKAPWPDGPRWAKYQTERADRVALDRWFGPGGRHHGMGVVCGAISGGLEMVEFEGRAVDEGILDMFLHAADAAGLVDLVDRIADGYQEATPGGGVHWLMRITGAAVPGNTKLASRPATPAELEQDPKDRIKVLIETRGEGGFVIVAPSNGTTHPTGRPWEQTLGGFDTVATITAEERAELHELARLFDLAPEPAAAPAPRTGAASGVAGARPGDDYNSRSTWRDLLEPAGWALLWERNGVGYWRRPGKPRGVSATTNALGTDRLKVFSSSTPFDTNSTYDRFGAMALLQHGGDIAAAAKALRSDGYGAITAGPPPRPPQGQEEPSLPKVVINGRPLQEVTAELVDHLKAANDPPSVFIRGGQLTRTRLDEADRPIVETMNLAHVRHRIARIVNPVKVNKDGHATHVATPLDVVQDIQASTAWPFPPLEAITEMPTLRPDGTIHHQAGYDPTTRLLHVPAPGLHVPPIPEQPTAEDITAAVALIDEMLFDFPFNDASDRANSYALILTPVVRPAVPSQVPLALIDAPEPGTGKSLLANLTSIIATGRSMSAKPMPDSDEEIRKMITSTLAESPVLIVLDNIDNALRSPALAGVLTTDMWADRILGRSEIVTLPNRATWVATGNNLKVAGDIARRCYRIRLDTKQARPYGRSGFLHADLPGWAKEHRGPLIAAALTLARAWWAAGQPTTPTPAIGGYTPWARIMSGILHVAGVEGFLGNLAQFHAEADTEASDWETFFASWVDRFDDQVISVSQIATEVSDQGSVLREALPGELADHIGKPGFNQRLGLALVKHEGRHYGSAGLHVRSHPKDRRRVSLWSVTAEKSADSRDLPPVTIENTVDEWGLSADSRDFADSEPVDKARDLQTPRELENSKSRATTPQVKDDESKPGADSRDPFLLCDAGAGARAGAHARAEGESPASLQVPRDQPDHGEWSLGL